MPRIDARMYVNVRLLTTETGPGTVLTRTVVRPNGQGMLEVLRNGGGKSTLTAIELFSLVPRVGSSRSRMRDLFRPGMGTTYIAYDIRRTSKGWKKGYDHDYLICAFERRMNEDEAGDVRRAWAFVPAVSAGNFDQLPLSVFEDGRHYPVPLEEFSKWAKGVPDGSFFTDRSLSEVEEALRSHGLSPKELATQLQINYDEGGIENYFGRGTTPESFFEDCLMPVVTDCVWGGRDGGWLTEAAIGLADIACDQLREISKLKATREYGDRLRNARSALDADRSARVNLSEFRCRATSLRSLTENAIASLEDSITISRGELANLEEQSHEVNHIDLSIQYYEAEDSSKRDSNESSELAAERDRLRDELSEVRHLLALNDAGCAYAEWEPKDREARALDSLIHTMKEGAGEMGKEASRLQAMAMAAWDDELARAREGCLRADAALDDARVKEARASEELEAAQDMRDAAIGRRSSAETRRDVAREGLDRVLEMDPPIAACREIASETNLFMKYDYERASAEATRASKEESRASKRLDAAKKEESDAEAAVELQQEVQARARKDEAEARANRDEAAKARDGAQASFAELDRLVNEVAPQLLGMRDLDELKASLDRIGQKVEEEKASAVAREASLRSQLEAFERGSMRLDQRLLTLMDELGIPFRTISDIARDSGIDLGTYLRDDPWLADVVFMGAEDARDLADAMAGRARDGSLVALVSTTESLDELLDSRDSRMLVCSNVVTSWIIDPEGWKESLQDSLEKARADLDSIGLRETALSAAGEAMVVCRTKLGAFPSLATLEDAAESLANEWRQANDRLSDENAHLEDAKSAHSKCVEARSGLERDSNAALDASRKWDAFCNAILELNERIDELEAANGNLKIAQSGYDSAKGKHDSAKREREEAFNKSVRATEHRQSVEKQKEEVWSVALRPTPDPEGRDAATLTTTWKAAREELEKKTEDLGNELSAKRGNLDSLRLQASVLRSKLDEACAKAGINSDEAREHSLALNPIENARLKDRESQLVPAFNRAKENASKAREREIHSSALFEAADKNLKSGGFQAPKPREECWGYDVEAEKTRIETQSASLQNDIERMGAEKTQMSLIGGTATQITRALAEAGAFIDYQPLHAPTIEERKAGEECDALERDYKEAIQRRRTTQDVAGRVIEETLGLDGLDSDMQSQAESTARTLTKSLEDVTEYEADGTIGDLDAAIDKCDKLVGLLEAQLQDYESRLEQTAKTCAADVAEALARLASIVKDATVNVSPEGETRKRVEFLELSLGGKVVRDIAGKPRAALTDDAKALLLPYLRSCIEKHLAPMTNEKDKRERARRDLSLSRLVRVYVGGGTIPCGISVRHATYTKLETRRHKDWSTLFKRNAMAQSGAETTLVFFVIYLAITKCVRSIEIPPESGDERFVILDNPFTKMSDGWAVEFLGRVADHFGCQMIVKTALREIAAHNVFPYVCSYREGKRSSDGTLVMDYETESNGVPEDSERDFDVFTTRAEQLQLGV